MKYLRLKLPKTFVFIAIPVVCLFVCICIVVVAAVLNKNIKTGIPNPSTAEIDTLLNKNKVFHNNLVVKAYHNIITNENTLHVKYQSEVPYGGDDYIALGKLQDNLADLLCANYQQFDKVYPDIESLGQDGTFNTYTWRSASSDYYYTCKNNQVFQKIRVE